MSISVNGDRRVVKFTSPGLKADVRLKVLNVDFHVHSILLKLHSSFFRKFLDSPDKEGSIPGSAEFKYEWVTKIDEDGSWHLVSAHNQTGKTKIKSLKADQKSQERAFDIILRSMYKEDYEIDSVSELQTITALADYYGALRVFSKTLPAIIWKSGLRLDINKHPIECLALASKLRNRLLFNECLVLCMGPWHSPAYRALPEGKLCDTVHNVYNNMALQVCFLEKRIIEVATSTSLNIGVQGGVLLDEERYCLRTHMSRVAAMLIQEEATISMPPYFQHILNAPNIPRVNAYLQRLLGPLMRNNLTINADGIPGVGKYRDYFLSAQIDDEDLPWDTKEVDW